MDGIFGWCKAARLPCRRWWPIRGGFRRTARRRMPLPGWRAGLARSRWIARRAGWSGCWPRSASRPGRSPGKTSTGWWVLGPRRASRPRPGAPTCRRSRVSTSSSPPGRRARSRPCSGCGWRARWMSSTRPVTWPASRRPRRRRRRRSGWRSSSSSCGDGSPPRASSARPGGITRCTGRCITRACGRRRRPRWSWGTCISGGARSARSTSGSARAPRPRGRGRGGCRCWTGWT